jgi:hypothetical protein
MTIFDNRLVLLLFSEFALPRTPHRINSDLQSLNGGENTSFRIGFVAWLNCVIEHRHDRAEALLDG